MCTLYTIEPRLCVGVTCIEATLTREAEENLCGFLLSINQTKQPLLPTAVLAE